MLSERQGHFVSNVKKVYDDSSANYVNETVFTYETKQRMRNMKSTKLIQSQCYKISCYHETGASESDLSLLTVISNFSFGHVRALKEKWL